MTAPDPGHVAPMPGWTKTIIALFTLALFAAYLFNTSRIVPEVKTNREYGKCLFALLAEHRQGNLNYDTASAEHHGFTLEQVEAMKSKSNNFEHYEGLSSDVLCKDIYSDLTKE